MSDEETLLLMRYMVKIGEAYLEPEGERSSTYYRWRVGVQTSNRKPPAGLP